MGIRYNGLTGFRPTYNMKRACPVRAVSNNWPKKPCVGFLGRGMLKTLIKRCVSAFRTSGRRQIQPQKSYGYWKPSEIIVKRCFPAPRPWGWPESSQDTSGRAAWIKLGRHGKTLGFLTFLTTADRWTTITPAEALGYHWESYGYRETLQNYWYSVGFC